jgi:hypothetical protein
MTVFSGADAAPDSLGACYDLRLERPSARPFSATH